MGMSGALPNDVTRFILRSIESVPHLEALLLLRSDLKAGWTVGAMARRLYISESRAKTLLKGLCAAGLVAVDETSQTYSYYPASAEFRDLLDRLAQVYARQLIEVTKLIHAKTGKQAQAFGDAFRWQREEG